MGEYSLCPLFGDFVARVRHHSVVNLPQNSAEIV